VSFLSCRCSLFCLIVVNLLTIIIPLQCTVKLEHAVAPAAKRRAVSPPHAFVDAILVEENKVELQSDVVFPLAKNKMPFTPVCFASVFMAVNLAYCLGLKITASSGVVGIHSSEVGVIMDNIKYSIHYAPDGRCVLRYEEICGRATTNTKLQAKNLARQPRPNAKDWGRFHTGQENNMEGRTDQDHKCIKAVCQFVLPFKVLKNVTEADFFSMYDPKTGGYTLSLLLWHADQSGRTAVQIKDAIYAIDSDDEEAEKVAAAAAKTDEETE